MTGADFGDTQKTFNGVKTPDKTKAEKTKGLEESDMTSGFYSSDLSLSEIEEKSAQNRTQLESSMMTVPLAPAKVIN